MKIFYSSLLTLFLLIVSLVSYGQAEKIILPNNYKSKRLKDAFKELEQKHHVKFFYKDDWIADIRLPETASDKPLLLVLSETLQGSPYTFFLLNDYQVVLVKRNEAQQLDSLYLPSDKIFNIKENFILSGNVKDGNTKQPIAHARVFLEEAKKNVVTDKEGFFSITLPSGLYTVTVSYIGLGKSYSRVELNENRRISIEMFEEPVYLREVTVTGDRTDKNVTGMQMGTFQIPMIKLRKLPAFLGETDVLKSVIALPGISTVGEGTSGFNVRGGSTDQNLVLMEDAPIFNSGHLFGLYSVYNPDIVKDLTLYKSGIPAQYGGRASAVLDVKLKDGAKEKLTGQGGLGLISSRLALEGPIFKEKGSFILAGRAAYPTLLFGLTANKMIRDSKAGFYDANLKLDRKINQNNSISLSGYIGGDFFQFQRDTLMGYGSMNGSLKWKRVISRKLFGAYTAAISNYRFNVTNPNGLNAFNWKSSVNYYNLKADYSFTPERHQIEFGPSIVFHYITPGSMYPRGEQSAINPQLLNPEQAVESGVYISDQIALTDKLSISVGIRYSMLNVLGPRQQFFYQQDQHRSTESIIDTINYPKAKVVTTYHGPEPRLLLNYLVNSNSSVKLSLTRTRQYIQLVSNTTAVSPVDIWKLSDKYIKPQISDQVSIGYFKNIWENFFEGSFEVYYKKMTNTLDYKDGANLFFNQALEAELLNGRGKAYGVEFMVKKNGGKLTGWFNYTFSRSLLQIDGINSGRYYPSNFDKPHMMNLVGTYQVNKRVSFAANFTYSTGRPATFPDAKYYVSNVLIPNFYGRNQGRLPDYHRLDLSFNIEPNHRKYKNWSGNWVFSIYNVYSRKNVYSVFFKNKHVSIPESYKLSILGTAFPSITYNFKFYSGRK